MNFLSHEIFVNLNFAAINFGAPTAGAFCCSSNACAVLIVKTDILSGAAVGGEFGARLFVFRKLVDVACLLAHHFLYFSRFN